MMGCARGRQATSALPDPPGVQRFDPGRDRTRGAHCVMSSAASCSSPALYGLTLAMLPPVDHHCVVAIGHHRLCSVGRMAWSPPWLNRLAVIPSLREWTRLDAACLVRP